MIGFLHMDIHASITPDVLHMLYQGIIKHVKWLSKVVGAAELDARFARIRPAHGLRHFLG